jgi:Membrane transporters of cations and cationic drugs
MNVYLTLFAAITFEVIGTMLLPASQNFTRILPTSILIASYGMSFYMLAIVSQKLPLSVVYASWSGIGIFSIAIFSYIFYKQSLNWQTILGLFFIVFGVTIVNIYKAQI